MPDREQRIRERAHSLWEQEGRPEGRDREHWERAMREIDDEAMQAGGHTGSLSSRNEIPAAGVGAATGPQASGTSAGDRPGEVRTNPGTDETAPAMPPQVPPINSPTRGL
jgi:hypothetical protein